MASTNVKSCSASTPQIKLRYFNVRARGEPIRMLLKLADVPFVDDRIPMDRWPSVKEETPFGQVPVLELNGGEVKLGQTFAILRYVAKEYGFAGANNLENAKLDMVADLIKDAWENPNIWKYFPMSLGAIPQPAEGMPAYFKKTVRPAVEKHLGIYENFLAEHSTDPLFNGEKKTTWVDVLAGEFFAKFVDFGEPDVLDAYPLVQKLVARVHALPNIKKYVKERPKTVA